MALRRRPPREADLASTVEPAAVHPGRPRWPLLPLYGASAVLTLGEGAVAVLVPPYLDELDINAGVIGAILAVYGVAALLARVPAAGWYVARRATLLITGGCLVMAVSFLLLPLASSVAGVAVLVGLDGAGFAVATTATMAALMERRPVGADAGSIMGWYTGSLGLGYAAAGFIAGRLADATTISTAIVVLAAVPAIAGVLLAFALRAAAPVKDGGLEVHVARGSRTHRLAGLRHAPPAVWLAFLVCLHVSLVHGVLSTFFPLYGLQVGLSLSQIGTLLGVHGFVAAGIRFLSGPLFRVLPYRSALPSMILMNSAAVAGMTVSTAYAVFVVGWGAVGLSRGVLRVASGALVMDEAGSSDAERGAASGVYLAGLDVGKIAGPVLGGLVAELAGLRGVFLTVSVAFPLAYFVLARRMSRPQPAQA